VNFLYLPFSFRIFWQLQWTQIECGPRTIRDAIAMANANANARQQVIKNHKFQFKFILLRLWLWILNFAMSGQSGRSLHTFTWLSVCLYVHV